MSKDLATFYLLTGELYYHRYLLNHSVVPPAGLIMFAPQAYSHLLVDAQRYVRVRHRTLCSGTAD